MRPQNRTLAEIYSTSGSDTNRQSFWHVYAVNLSYRFPDITNFSQINETEVRNTAEFSLLATRIGQEILDENSQTQSSFRTKTA